MTTIVVAEETKLITGEEFLDMGDIGPCELIDGRIVAIAPLGVEHGYFETEIAVYLRAFNVREKRGWILSGEVGIYTRHNPDRVRGMDVAFISYQKLPTRPSGYLEVAPELIVEIISPNDSWRDVRDKIEEYFAIGVERVWLIDPTGRLVYVYHSPTDSLRLTLADTLHGEGVLASFTLELSDFFTE